MLKPLNDYLTPLLAFKARVKELGLDLPLILHAGETLGDGSKADNNLYDAILLGTKRIGHGSVLKSRKYSCYWRLLGWYYSFSLVKHPHIMQICREKGIAIEVCPISYVFARDYSFECLSLIYPIQLPEMRFW